MDAAIELVGLASKRGLIPRLRPAGRLRGEIDAWLREAFPDVVRSTRCLDVPVGEAPVGGAERPGSTSTLHVALHPAARDVEISADETGRVRATAAAAGVGAGYQTFTARLLERLGDEVGIAWTAAVAGAVDGLDADAADRGQTRASEPGSAGRYVATARPTAEAAQLAWLGRALAVARAQRSRGARAIHVAVGERTRFRSDAALVTPLGPRDDAWLEAALADTRVAVDVLPWWADAMDGRYHLNRALCLMWTEVRWRAPATDDERAVLDEALAHLRRAHALDPELAFPWREWHELLELRAAADPVVAMVATRASEVADRDGADAPRIGYRRAPVTAIHAGWQLEIPGAFSERLVDGEWWAGEGGRSITIAAVETGDERGPMRPQAFLAMVAGDMADEAVRHEDGEVIGRARLREETASGISVGVLDGFSAVLGRGAAIRIEFDDPADWSWALDRWKALRPV